MGDELFEALAQPVGIALRQVDLVLDTIDAELDSLCRFAAVDIILKTSDDFADHWKAFQLIGYSRVARDESLGWKLSIDASALTTSMLHEQPAALSLYTHIALHQAYKFVALALHTII
jgi:hypothetical protein